MYPKVPDFEADVKFETIDDAIDVYVKTRDDLAACRKEFNKYEADAKYYMDRIEMFLKDKADEIGVESFKCKSGTAFRSVKTQYQVGNWDDFIGWVLETGNVQCLEKRAAKNACKEIHDEEGDVPPGLNYRVEVGMDVRRPTK